MHLIQILLPLFDNAGERFPSDLFGTLRAELVDRFGGLTAFTQAPAEGIWQNDDRHTAHDKIVVFEVMSPKLDRSWWREYRSKLEAAFRQDELVVRVHTIEIV